MLDAEMETIRALRVELNGRVISPEDPGYEQARSVFYGGVDRRPATIVRAADANDIARVLSLATEAGLELAVRSGGHAAPDTAPRRAGWCSISAT